MKIRRYSNFRLEVTPERNYHDRPHLDAPASAPNMKMFRDFVLHVRCRDIEEAIKRHVDGIQNVSVIYDDEEVCEFCGYRWEEEETDPQFIGQPCCCREAQDEWDENRKGVKK